MAIERWDPFREMMSLRDVMDRLFQESFVRPTTLRLGQPSISVAVDLAETAEGYELRASVPGWKPEEISITVDGNRLTISGERKTEEKAEKGATYHLRERSFASFSRSFTLPIAVDADKAKATFEHGELILTLPKAESAKPKRIPIGSRAGA